MASIETIKQHIHESQYEEALLLLKKANNESAEYGTLLNYCKKNLSDQYLYQLKECIVQKKIQEGEFIINKYRLNLGDSKQISLLEAEIMGLKHPFRLMLKQTIEKFEKTQSWIYALLFVLVELLLIGFYHNIFHFINDISYFSYIYYLGQLLLTVLGCIFFVISIISIQNKACFFQCRKKTVYFMSIFCSLMPLLGLMNEFLLDILQKALYEEMENLLIQVTVASLVVYIYFILFVFLETNRSYVKYMFPISLIAIAIPILIIYEEVYYFSLSLLYMDFQYIIVPTFWSVFIVLTTIFVQITNKYNINHANH